MNIAVVGSTGMVGQKFLELLEERKFPVTQLKLFASQKNEGRKVTFQSREFYISSLQEGCFNGLDIVFFSSGEKISREWAPKAVKSGARVIDNSSAFRMESSIPLVVPEINAQAIKPLKKGEGGIIANPNCSTIQLVLALKPLHSHFGLESVSIASYQSLSGAGREALNLFQQELYAMLGLRNVFKSKDQKLSENSECVSYKADGNDRAWLNNIPSDVISLPSDKKSVAFNCIPQIGSINEDGFSTEEAKLMRETKKILALPNLKVTATAVRVPVLNGHGEAVTVTFAQPVGTKEEVTAVLETQKGLKVLQGEHLPHQRFVDGRDDVYVGRIRAVPEEKGKSWMMWIVADNLRKGAALNGLQIAEALISSP